jgi:hypothetical protein
MNWGPGFLERSPMFEPLREHAAALSARPDWPTREAIGALLAVRAPSTRAGAALRLVAPSRSDESYETRLHHRGELQHRERNWHDLFNALAWLAYPRTKAALTAAHSEHPALRNGRGRARDALTLFDESGAIVACTDPSLLEDLRAFRWKQLFWSRRERLLEAMRVYVFGHAVFEKALNPYVGMTAHALLLEVDAEFMAAPLPTQMRTVDAMSADRVPTMASPRDLSPLPLLGVPGWWAGNAAERFYDNDQYFRRSRSTRMEPP